MRHICKMEILEIKAVIKYFCMKGMPPKEIHEDFMETPYSTVKKWAAGFKSIGGHRTLRLDGVATP